MRSVLQFLVRVTSFLQKEIFAILRQPRLIFTLILGPFLILLIFGLGFESTQIPMETLFVVPEESNLRPLVEEHGDPGGIHVESFRECGVVVGAEAGQDGSFVVGY